MTKLLKLMFGIRSRQSMCFMPVPICLMIVSIKLFSSFNEIEGNVVNGMFYDIYAKDYLGAKNKELFPQCWNNMKNILSNRQGWNKNMTGTVNKVCTAMDALHTRWLLRRITSDLSSSGKDENRRLGKSNPRLRPISLKV